MEGVYALMGAILGVGLTEFFVRARVRRNEIEQCLSAVRFRIGHELLHDIDGIADLPSIDELTKLYLSDSSS